MADIKISGLPEATALTGSELFLASQTAADVKATLQRLRDELDWMRPSDWPAMPATAANTVHALVAIHDHVSNNHAVRISVSSGTYSVDWGDGSTSSGVASNTTAEHSYTYGDVALGSVTSRGYKVAVVTITTSGGNITVVNTSVPPTGSSQPLQWLELQINAPAATTFSNLGTNTAGLSRLIEHINFVAHGTVTALSFDGMAGLVKITEPGTLFTNITSLQSVFRGCSSLRRINLSGLGTGITTMQTAFQNCSSLTELIFPSGTLGSSLTNLTQAFNGCGRITSLTFPSGAFSGVTTAANAFSGCASLGRIVFPSGAFASTTAMGSFLANCTSLRYVEFGSALSAVTDIGGMLNNCNTLQHVKFASGGFGSLSSATTNFVNGCWALARIENCSIPLTFTLLNCRLGAAALDEVYTALPTISSQTITVTGNHGTSGDTPSIATGKGWTVMG
jgi:hypothetical protein